MNSYFKFFSFWSRADYSLSGYVKYHRTVRAIALFLLAITFFSYLLGTKPSQHLRQAHIARVDIGSVSNYNATWLSDLRVALDNPKALGVMLVVDQASSMGGDFFDIESAIGRIRAARDNKPVVTYVYGYALGGNYVLASETNYIVAQRTATLGGLSVAVSSFDPKPFLRRIGIDVVTKGFGDLKVMPEKDDKNYDSYIQHRNEVYKNLYHWMLSSVQENRNLSAGNMKKIAEGQWYLGSVRKAMVFVMRLVICIWQQIGYG